MKKRYYLCIIIIYRDFFPLSRGGHAEGILSIFTESTKEMVNSAGPVMAS